MPLTDKRTLIYLFIALALTAFGILEIASVSPHAWDRQLSWAILGIFFFFFFLFLPMRTLKALSPFLVIFGIISLLAVIFLGKGPVKRWINIGSIHIQPSEAMKFAIIPFLPKFFESGKGKGSSFLKSGLFSAVPVFLVLVEPDLGTSLFFLFIWLQFAFLANVSSTLLLAVIDPILAMMTSFSKVAFGIFVGSLIFAVRWAKVKPVTFLIFLTVALSVGFSTPVLWQKGLKSYQRKRILAFVDTREKLSGAAWQTFQAKVALGAGGFRGRGYKRGTQIRFSFLPAARTDFIYSSLGEEFGFAGTFGILLLFFVLIDLSLCQSRKAKDPYVRLLGAGIFGYFVYHSLLNIASNLGVFPVVGIPLPFLTAGGSHILVDFSLLGIWSRALWEDKREGLRFKEPEPL